MLVIFMGHIIKDIKWRLDSLLICYRVFQAGLKTLLSVFPALSLCWSFMQNNADFCWPAGGNAWARCLHNTTTFTEEAAHSPVHNFLTNRKATKILWHQVMSEAWRRDTLLLSWDIPTVYMCCGAFSPTNAYCIYAVFSLSERIPHHWRFAYCVCLWISPFLICVAHINNSKHKDEIAPERSPWMKERIGYSEHTIQEENVYI